MCDGARAGDFSGHQATQRQLYIYIHTQRTYTVYSSDTQIHTHTHSAFTCSQPIYIVCPIVQIRIILRSIYKCDYDYEYIGHAWRVYIYYIIAVLGDGENALVRLFSVFFLSERSQKPKRPNSTYSLILFRTLVRSFRFIKLIPMECANHLAIVKTEMFDGGNRGTG